MPDKPKQFMKIAFAAAQKAADLGEIPVGAVLVGHSVDGAVQEIAIAHNLCETQNNPCKHAELLAIEAACTQLGTKNLAACDLYVTLEPCPMCAAAISFARVRRVYFGAYDAKSGGEFLFAAKQLHHKPEVYGGIMETECAKLLQKFFAAKR